MRLTILGKMLVMEFTLTVMVTMNIVARKKSCFGYFYNFVSRVLTLRPRNTFFEPSLVGVKGFYGGDGGDFSES